MKKLKCNPIKLKKGKLYRIPKIIPARPTEHNSWCFYTFQGNAANVLYGTYIGFVENCIREFKRYPDQKRVYVMNDCIKDAYNFDIYEFESEDEMIMDNMK